MILEKVTCPLIPEELLVALVKHTSELGGQSLEDEVYSSVSTKKNL